MIRKLPLKAILLVALIITGIGLHQVGVFDWYVNQKTLPRIHQQLLPSENYIIVYWQNYYGLFSPLELIGFMVMLGEEARKKIAAKCRRIGRELNGLMQNPRPP